MKNPIVNASAWPVDMRQAVLTQMLTDVHPGTIEDFEFSEAVFGMSIEDCLDIFRTAPRLAVLFGPSCLPCYLVAFDKNLSFSSFSTNERERCGLYLTKHFIRWMRTDEGRAFFEATQAFAEQSDIAKGSFTEQWIKACGYVSAGETILVAPDWRINRYRYVGV